MIEKLKEKLEFELIECKFIERDNLLFLDIEINCPTMKEIEHKSKIISNILDEIDNSEKIYYLNIYSSGVEKEIKLNEIENYVEKNIKISLINQYLNSNYFEGELIEISDESIKMKINIKGCFRKLEFRKDNIKQLNESIKLIKNKKG